MRLIEKTQRALYNMLQREVANNLDLEQGAIKKTARNYQFKVRFDQIQRQFIQGEYKDLFEWLALSLNAQADQVTDYYRSMFDNWRTGNEDNIRKLASRRIGINPNGTLRDGWLHDLYTDDTYFVTIKRRISRAIGVGQSYREFRAEIRQLISGIKRSTTQGRGIGLLETHLRTFVYDIFAQNDRSIMNDYAEDLKLDTAIYQGGIMDTSRKFCQARNNKIYTRDEIESWKNLDWRGKSRPYNPLIDCGGYNCRHTLDWISEELAEQLINRQGVNEYKEADD